MNPELLISNEMVQKFIQNKLDKKESKELKQLLDSDESYRLLAKILNACRQHYQSQQQNSNNNKILTFEQIDNIILQSLSDKISADNLNHVLSALGHEVDFTEKLMTRIHSNVAATTESEGVNLEEMDVLTNDELLQKMNIKQAEETKQIKVKKENLLQNLINPVSDFIGSLAIPKPAYYLVPLILITMFVSFESTLFFAEHRLIDNYALDKWAHYEVDVTTLRSTDDPQINPDMLALINSQSMALSSFIVKDYAEAIKMFDVVIANVETRDDIPNDLKFDIYFMAGMSSLSFAMTDEKAFDDQESLNKYLNASITHFTQAKKFMENESTDDKNALYYHLGLALVFQGNDEVAIDNLKYIGEGLFFRNVEELKQRINKE